MGVRGLPPVIHSPHSHLHRMFLMCRSLAEIRLKSKPLSPIRIFFTQISNSISSHHSSSNPHPAASAARKKQINTFFASPERILASSITYADRVHCILPACSPPPKKRRQLSQSPLLLEQMYLGFAELVSHVLLAYSLQRSYIAGVSP